MEEFFIINIKKIDKSWNIEDLYISYNALDYCEEILDIPQEYILDVMMTSEGLEITLTDAYDEDEDWYMQLKRIS